jgi:hypothetical protein
MLVSIPGEMTAEMGRRVRHAVEQASQGHGVTGAIISGLANEYADYFTTPQEYDAQHYEGAATVYGRASSVALEETLVKLTHALVTGTKGPKPYKYDPRNGVKAKAPRFSKGRKHGKLIKQPDRRTQRLLHPGLAWHGGPRGFDRPLERAFVKVQRRVGHHWRTATSDLGLDVLWRVNSDGIYRAHWEPPYDHRLGTYRFRIKANKYSLTSRRFRLRPSPQLKVRRLSAPAGQVAVELDYPKPVTHEDVGEPPPDVHASLTARPTRVLDGTVTFLVNGHRRTVSAGPDGRFVVNAPSAAAVKIPRRGARDRFGNFNGKAFG